MSLGFDQVSAGYALALQRYVAERGENALARGYEVGREALTGGLGVLDMATIHARAVREALRRRGEGADCLALLDAVETFSVEALSPFEMAQRGYRDANTVLQRLNEVLEGQVKRVASTLHDEAAQLLVSVHLALADLARQHPGIISEVQSMRRLLDQIEARMRQLSHELRPSILDDLGLAPALEFLAETVSKRFNLPVSVHVLNDRALPAPVETALYRIAQEALTNVAKHARATQVDVEVHRAAQRVVCSVRDDGVGFDSASLTTRRVRRGLGLVEMQERTVALGGVLRVTPGLHRGTEITVEIPLEA